MKLPFALVVVLLCLVSIASISNAQAQHPVPPPIASGIPAK
jgi:hypothetical protein